MASPNTLLNSIMRTIDFRAFYESEGVILTETDKMSICDAEGAILARGSIINIKTGRWKMSSKQTQYSTKQGNKITKNIASGEVLDFIMLQYNFISKETGETIEDVKLRCLRVLCDYCKIPFAIGETTVGLPFGYFENISQNTLTMQKRELMTCYGLNVNTIAARSIGVLTDEKGPMKYLFPSPNVENTINSAIQFDLCDNWRFYQHPKLKNKDYFYGLDIFAKENWSDIILCSHPMDTIIINQERKERTIGSICVLGTCWPDISDDIFKGRRVFLFLRDDVRSDELLNRCILPFMKHMDERKRINGMYDLLNMSFGMFKTKEPWTIFKSKKWDDFKVMLNEVHKLEFNNTVGEEEVFKLKSFEEINDPKYTDKRVSVPSVIAGETSNIFDVVRRFKVDYCNRIVSATCRHCEGREFIVDDGSAINIAACKSSEESIARYCRQICCAFGEKPIIKILEKTTYREVQGSNKVKGSDSSHKVHSKNIFLKVSNADQINFEPRAYNLEGWIRTNPKSSVRTMLINKITPIANEWEDYDIQKNIESLNRMKSVGYVGITKQLTHDVTRIYNCDKIIMANLLTYCSPIELTFNREDISGWLKTIVIGDTGVGKTQVYEKISKYVDMGDMFSGATGKRTGLSYATVNSGGAWLCQAGLLPMNNRQILCIDEAQDLSYEDLRTLTTAIDTGTLKVATVARGDYETKTRVIINCNPKNDRTMDCNIFGACAARDVFPKRFLRRVDMLVCVRRLKNREVYNIADDGIQYSFFKPEDLRALFMYAWSLTKEKIIFPTVSRNMILTAAESVSKKFGAPEDLPVAGPTDIRKKLARIAASWAILDCSTENDFESIIVKPEYVTATEKFLTKLYNDPDTLLGDYSTHYLRQSELTDFDVLKDSILTRYYSDRKKEGNTFTRFVVSLLNEGELDREQSKIKYGDEINDYLCELQKMHFIYLDEESICKSLRMNRFFERIKKDDLSAYKSMLEIGAKEKENA